MALGSSNSLQWQVPIGLQLVPGALIGLGMLTLKESTRWLTRKGRHREALESLKWIRADDSQAVIDEMEDIRRGVETEARAADGFQYKELLHGDNFKRVFTAFAIFAAQQATGATAFAYFAPQYFRLLVGSGNKDLLLTAVFGAVKVLACGAFVLFVSERVGRRNVLIGGAVLMAACQITTAAVDRAFPPPEEGSVTSSGVLTVVLIYLFVIAYNFSWGPLPWPYVSEYVPPQPSLDRILDFEYSVICGAFSLELTLDTDRIFPSRIREPGVAVGVASQWLFNLVFSLTTPYMMSNLGWGTFLLWGVFDIVIAVLAFLFLQETKGLSLEAIAHTQFKGSSSSALRHNKRDDEAHDALWS